MMTPAELASLVRTVHDWPKPGIAFRDITTLIGHPRGLASAVAHLCAAAQPYRPDVIVAVEARGFLFGSAIAHQLGCGLVPVRKPGKLPGATLGVDYALEYGSDRLELHEGAIQPGQRALLVDDLLATGGTILAAAQLVRAAGGELSAALFLIDLPHLGGSQRLRDAGLAHHALLAFDGD